MSPITKAKGSLLNPIKRPGPKTNGSTFMRILKKLALKFKKTKATSPITTQPIAAQPTAKDNLFDVIRGAFVSAGILSASYKFKVLPSGYANNEVLVLIDVGAGLDRSDKNLMAIEMKIIDTARNHGVIRVKSVYWRVGADINPPVAKNGPTLKDKPVTQLPANKSLNAEDEVQHSVFGKVTEEELTAFRVAVTRGVTSPSRTQHVIPVKRYDSGESVTRDFEDTETFFANGDSGLHLTQYGNLGSK